MHNFMLAHDSGFAWSEEERGSFRTDFFPPVNFPMIPHTPWVERNFPIPPGIYEDICAICQGTPAVVPTRAKIRASALNKGGSGDPGARSIVGRARARTSGVVYGVLLPSIALNCLPGCCTKMFNCSGILD
jgi:hypothetical protein